MQSTLVSDRSAAQNTMQPSTSAPGSSLLLSRGYGFIPKAVMQDRSLTPSAKALYAYLSSFCGTGSTAWPTVNKICYDLDIGRTAFYSAMNGLKGAGYITVARVKDRGRFAHSVYTLESELPHTEPESSATPCVDSPHADGPKAACPQVGSPRPGGAASNKNNPNNTTPNNNTFKDNDDELPAYGPQACLDQTETTGTAAGKDAERRLAAQTLAHAMGGMVRPELQREANRAAVGAVFQRCFGRAALAAELDVLAGLLAQCEMDALTGLLHKAAEHAPASPAPYIKKMAQKYRSDAIAYGFITRPFERLTQTTAERVDDKNEGFL